jgi:hypothetical protein
MRSQRIALLLVLAAASASWSAASPLRIIPTPSDQDRPEIEVRSSSGAGLQLSFTLPALGVEDVEMDGRTFQILTIPGGGSAGDVGSPELPTFGRLLAIPAHGSVKIVPVVEEEEVRGGYRVVPAQSEEGSALAYDEEEYARDDFGDEPIVEAGAPAILRDLRVVPLTFRPVSYNPAEGTLKIARRIRIDVTFTDAPSENEKATTDRPIPPSFDDLYRALVVNYEEMAGGRDVQPGAWVVICPNDTGVTSRLQTLVDWRKRKGSPVTLVTTAQTGTTTASIKAWIQTAYDTWDVPPEYIVLAGDAGGTYNIPTWYESLSGYGGEGDHPYAQLAGGDILADVHLGRISFTSYTELEAIVNKIVGYESTPYTVDRDWYQRACLVGDQSSSGYSVIQLQQWVKVRLRQLGYTEIDTVFAADFPSKMATALNKGDTIFSYRGWLNMSGWSNSNTYLLTNGWKMPFAVIMTCGTGSFASETSCRSEGFLRANAGVNSPKGGIGAIGTATTGTHTRYNNCMQFGVLQGLLWEQQYTLGAALTRGKLEMYLNYEKNEPDRVMIWSYWNNLMGDPAVECWTGYPQAISVSAPASLPIGANSVSVTVTQGGSPEPGAQVCLLKGTETYAVGRTNAAGIIELPVSAATSGSMLLTVTKHNRMPYLASIPVAAQTNFVGFQAFTVDDDATGGSSGNGNGQTNPGETIELPVQLKNFGSQSAASVTATLTSSDPYVTITDNQETYGAIAAGASDWSDEDFDFSVSSTCPDGHAIRFGLDITASTGSWHSLIDLPVFSGALTSEGTTVYNAGPNGLFDPGETVQMSVLLRNTGQVNATGISGVLTSLSPKITVTDGTGSFGTINVGAVGDNSADRFSIRAASDTYQGHLATFRLITTFSGTVQDTTLFSLTVGQATSDDPIGPDQRGYYAFDNTDLTYADCPTYSWVEIDPAYGGSGTQITLNDLGTYQDASTTIDLPFSFSYYGTSSTRATVCSNGWIVMGSTYLTDYRNWTLPGAGGPKGIIAAFWDDLRLSTTGKVFRYFDAVNHRFIIEWSHVTNEPGSAQTFEIILYDPAAYPTSTGDGVIVFQYNTVNNTDSGDNYATVGIESPDGFDGLLYTFNNNYAAGAPILAAGRAIKFTPSAMLVSGTLEGTVTNSSAGGAPIDGAEVVVVQAGRTLTTGQMGDYSGAVPPGSFTVIARHAGFLPDTTLGVVIQQNQTTTLNFSLTDILGPSVTTTTHASTSDTLGPYVIPVTISDLSGIAEKTLYYRAAGGEFTPLPLIPQSGDSYTGEIPGQAYITRVEYYVYARDGAGLVTIDPLGAPGNLYSFFVTQAIGLFADDMETDKGWTVGGPEDTATTGIWTRVDPNATYNGTTMVQPEDDDTPDPGTLCFITGQSAVGAGQGDNDVDGGQTTLTSPLLDLTSYGTVTLRYHRWYTNDTGNDPGTDTWLVQITDDNGASWVTLESTTASDRSWRLVEFDLSAYISMTASVRIRFIASDVGSGSVVEAGVDDVEILLTGVTDAPESPAHPAIFALQQNRPNPCSSGGTSIGFSLARSGTARLLVFDVQGRTVRRLVDGTCPAGFQSVVWDGTDDRGTTVPSGIYLYRLEADGRANVRKLIRVE